MLTETLLKDNTVVLDLFLFVPTVQNVVSPQYCTQVAVSKELFDVLRDNFYLVFLPALDISAYLYAKYEARANT